MTATPTGGSARAPTSGAPHRRSSGTKAQPSTPTPHVGPAIDAALAAGDIDRATHLLLTVLANAADPNGQVTMTADEMAARTRYSTRTVSRAVNAAVTAGLIERTAWGAGNAHGSKGSTYRFPAHAIHGVGLPSGIGSACTRPASPFTGSSAEPRTGKSWNPKTSKRYRDYLKSPGWRDVIDRYKQTRPFICAFSPDGDGCSGAIQLHHLTYDRVFHEDSDDLMPLCRRHHRQLHHHFDSERRQDPSVSRRDFAEAWVRPGPWRKYP